MSTKTTTDVKRQAKFFKPIISLPPSAPGLAIIRSLTSFMGLGVGDTDDLFVVEQKGEYPGHWVNPRKSTVSTVILYFHGGAMLLGNSYGHKPLLTSLARETSCRIFATDYPLAPENPFPAAVEDCYRHYRYLLNTGHDATSIVFAGDSAGGNLVFATMLKIIERGEIPLPLCGVALSPWLDLTDELTAKSRTSNADTDDTLPATALAPAAALYAPSDALRRNPLVSPLYASNDDLAKLPPMYLEVGKTEMLHDDSTIMHRRLCENAPEAVRSQHVLHEHEDEPHGFHMHGEQYHIVVESFRRVRNFIRLNEPAMHL